MDISKIGCPDCEKTMTLTAASCAGCGLKLEGEFEVSALGRLSEEDQVFVVAFLRHHGSIRQMERIMGISYPTVKNRLRAIVSRLDETFKAPSSNAVVLEQLARGEITVDEALERLGMMPPAVLLIRVGAGRRLWIPLPTFLLWPFWALGWAVWIPAKLLGLGWARTLRAVLTSVTHLSGLELDVQSSDGTRFHLHVV